MKRLFSLFAACAMALGLAAAPAHARLDGIMNLAGDDKAALALVKDSPRHVLVYFGDHAN